MYNDSRCEAFTNIADGCLRGSSASGVRTREVLLTLSNKVADPGRLVYSLEAKKDGRKNRHRRRK